MLGQRNKHSMNRFTPKNISIAIAAIVIIWIASGLIFGTSREDTKQAEVESGGDIAKLLKVETLSAQPYTRVVTLNGYTEANRSVEMKPEVDGKVVALPVKKGSLVAAGEVIVQLDNRDRKEKLAEARAMVAAREIEYSASQELQSKGYRPRIGLAESKAALEQARVALAQAQLAADNTLIKAPFHGRLEELNVEIGDFVLSGFMGSMNNQVMALVVEDNPIIVTSQISEKDLPSIDKDAEVEIMLSGARSLTGKIRYMSQVADPQSRSFKVEVEVPNPNHDIPVGMTATVKLPASAGLAYQVSSSVLALDDTGKVGVKMVGEDGVVQFHYVDVLASNDDGMWIGGLPDSIRLITQGQAFVSAGQKVPQTERVE